MSEAWLRAADLHKGFRSEHRELQVLRGVELEVAPGELVAVTGASGSGKSTLLNLLGSLDRPDRGSIVWAGQDLASLGDAQLSRLRNRCVGFVFQAHHLLADFDALENVLLPARALGKLDATVRRRAESLLERVGLEDRRTHRPGELSGGEQQRVAVARALIASPQLLLADEPGGNLDRERADALHEVLLLLCRAEGVAMVVVTHDRELARRAHRWLQLHEGRLQPHGVGST
jgi:lipoprotein-releasing system ATP-binding protein